MSGFSNLSRMTQLSTLSIDTQLSVQTNVDEIYGGQYTMSPFEAFPMGENIDPQQQRNAIVGLVSYLMDENQVSVVIKASIYNVLIKGKNGLISPSHSFYLKFPGSNQ